MRKRKRHRRLVHRTEVDDGHALVIGELPHDEAIECSCHDKRVAHGPQQYGSSGN